MPFDDKKDTTGETSILDVLMSLIVFSFLKLHSSSGKLCFNFSSRTFLSMGVDFYRTSIIFDWLISSMKF